MILLLNYFYYPETRLLSQTIINMSSNAKLLTSSADYVYERYPGYTPEDLAKHRAVISLPYSVMSYRTSELYALAIPLFIPSLKFYRSHYNKDMARFGLGWDRTVQGHPYCEGGDAHVAMEKKNSKFIRGYRHQYSPNLDLVNDPEAEMYWMQMADFYEWPHIQYFDDFQHLKVLLLNSDFEEIHFAMKKEMNLRKSIVEKRLLRIQGQQTRSYILKYPQVRNSPFWG